MEYEERERGKKRKGARERRKGGKITEKRIVRKS